jgi:hypothetical protein
MATMKTNSAWLGVGLWLAASIAWGAQGLWLGEDDRVAVVVKSAGAEWATAAGVLLECTELDIPLTVFHGALTEAERAAEMDAFPSQDGESGTVEETGAGFEALAGRLADFDPSHVILAGWEKGEGFPVGVAEALDETPAMILQTVDARGDYTMSLADFQREMRNVILPAFGLEPSNKGVDRFRRVEADEIVVAEADAEVSVPREPATFDGRGKEAPAEVEEVRSKPEGKGVSKLKPRTKLPAAPKPKAWYEMPASW